MSDENQSAATDEGSKQVAPVVKRTDQEVQVVNEGSRTPPADNGGWAVRRKPW